ncbi:restriction endonuclease subunit S [Streptococcus suis]|nr:restriction endonuclease subunit S [Streptococcus suis]
MPYEIPDSWEWVRLRNLGIITSGGTPKSSEPSYYGGDIIWITPADLGKQQKNKLFTTSSKTITELGLQKSTAQLISKHSIVYSSRAPIGHINIVNDDFTTNQGCKSVTPLLANLDFLYWVLQFRTKDIILRSSGTTFKEISASGFGETLLPLPPIAEQKRIVAQIEHALEKVEVYAESYKKLQELDKAFPDKLKKSILQYAMQGKLVPQDPNDEPVEVLLEKIKAEKQKLYEEGKLKKKDLGELVLTKGDDSSPYKEVPYSIPESWTWVKLGDIGLWGAGATPSKSNIKYYEPQSIPWLLTGDLNDGYITNIPNKISELALEKTSVKLNPKGTVLIAMYGATIGKLGILTFPATTNQACCACNTLFEADKLFLFYFLMSERKKFTSRAEGGAQPNISKEKIVNTLFPLPPLAEQQRIVSKISQVFSVIESLV